MGGAPPSCSRAPGAGAPDRRPAASRAADDDLAEWDYGPVEGRTSGAVGEHSGASGCCSATA
nr:hypothetical protein [Cellulosimicrobium sp. MM]